MIYGLSINGQAIPDGVRKKFREEITGKFRAHPRDIHNKSSYKIDEGTHFVTIPRGYRAWLMSVAQSPEELDQVLASANNGNRSLHVEERKTAAGIWYGIYQY